MIAIIGAGIAGLAAAFFLRDEPVRTVVLEGSRQPAGSCPWPRSRGAGFDVGAEALLARRPEGTGLVRAAGLGGDLRSPGTTAARIWSRGAMHRLPARQYMGVPADTGEPGQTGLLSAGGLERAAGNPGWPPPTGTATCRCRATWRPGSARRSWTGSLTRCSAGCTPGGLRNCPSRRRCPAWPRPPGRMPRWPGRPPRCCHPRQPVLPGAGRPPSAGGPPRPARPAVFTTLAGGLGTLPPALASASGAEVRTGAMVRELARWPHGWRLTVGSAHAPEYLDADAVVLALPGQLASRLLGGVPGAAAAAAALGEISYASMAIVTLAYPETAFAQLPDGSGYLVPAVDGRPVKAVTFSSVKWPHLREGADGLVFVRCSVGRIGEEAILQRDDGELAALAAADLAAATGVGVARPTSWSPGGAAPCPSTRSGTWTGWPGSRPVSRPCPAWRPAAPPTRGSAFPRASAPRGPRWIRPWPGSGSAVRTVRAENRGHGND